MKFQEAQKINKLTYLYLKGCVIRPSSPKAEQLSFQSDLSTCGERLRSNSTIQVNGKGYGIS